MTAFNGFFFFKIPVLINSVANVLKHDSGVTFLHLVIT